MDKRSFLFVSLLSLSFLMIQAWFGPSSSAKQATEVKPQEREEIAFFHDKKEEPETAPLAPAQKESFYVLENDYQQLVFSTKGGALSEINFPFKDSSDEKSLVKEIGVDREIEENSPQNAHFPLHPYYIAGKNGLQKEGSLGGYYPLLRRSLFDKRGEVKSSAASEYYALTLLNDDFSLADADYRVTRFEKDLIELSASVQGKTITKTFSFSQAPYCIDLEISIQGSPKGIWLSSGVPDVELVGGSYAPLLKYQITTPSGSEVDSISLPKKTTDWNRSVSPSWISNNNGFLGLIVDPLSYEAQGYRAERVEGVDLPTRLTLVDAAYHLYPAQDYPGYRVSLPMQEGKTHFRVFAGPFDKRLLKQLDKLYSEPKKNYNPEYAKAQSIQGWFSFISEPFTKFLYFLIQIFFKITRSWAVSIVLLTIALRAMMYPLNSWSIRSTSKMQEMGPKIKALQERYKGDPKRMQMEVMKVYKEGGVSPLMGCLPMLIQMPFLLGMFYLLKSTFALRGAVFIPGWIDNLAAPDVLFRWGPPLWFIGNQFHLLPFLMAAMMYLQQKMTMKAPEQGKPLSDTEKQQKMMGKLMPIFLLFIFYNLPSGVNLYFLFSTLLDLLQRKWLARKAAKTAPPKS